MVSFPIASICLLVAYILSGEITFAESHPTEISLCAGYLLVTYGTLYLVFKMKVIVFRNTEVFRALMSEEKRLLKDIDNIVRIFF